MKKIMSLILTCVMIFTSSISCFANSNDSEKDVNQGNTVSIYDGAGELIEVMDEEEFNSMVDDEMQAYSGRASKLMTKVTAKLSAIATILFYTEMLSGVNVAQWVYKNVALPSYQSLKTMSVYSRSGHAYNPYPPHSYEGATWQRNNFYVVVH